MFYSTTKSAILNMIIPLCLLLLLASSLAEDVPHLAKDTSENAAVSFAWSFAKPNYASDNVEFVGNVIFELAKLKLVTQCAMLCLRNVACRSYTFYGTSGRCVISDQDHVSNPDKILPKNGTQYYTREAFSIDQEANPCLKHPCQNYGTCVVKETDNYMCNCPFDYTGVNCETNVVIEWSGWSAWSPCNQACGVGVSVRGRSCEDKKSGTQKNKNLCVGPDQEIVSCKTKDCPGWTQWTTWTTCSAFGKCGQGEISRTRSCLNEDSDLKCLGPSVQTSPCFSIACNAATALKNSLDKFGDGPLLIFDDLLNDWVPLCAPLSSDWSIQNSNVVCQQMGFLGGAKTDTSASAEGFKTFAAVGFNCKGDERYLTSCPNTVWNLTNTCPSNKVVALQCKVDGRFSMWTEWSQCSATCAEGTSKRTRLCNSPSPSNGGHDCQGESTQSVNCTKPPCPVNAYWSTWAEWRSCSASCGGGVQSRNRTCVPGKYGGNDCLGVPLETRNCNQNACPVDGVWSLWSAWTSCSATCGGGQKNRNRTCQPPLYGGVPCSGEASQLQDCNTINCPVDGAWQQWSDWSSCNVSCGGGTRLRVRHCKEPLYGGKDCVGSSYAYENCNDDPCKIDGQWSLWSRWFACSVTCGSGTQTRMRICSEAQFGGNTCDGDSEQSMPCTAGPCPSPGLWTEWGPWGLCSATCGTGGKRTRNRNCNMTSSGTNSLPCQPSDGNLDTKSCNAIACSPAASSCRQLFDIGLEEDAFVNLAINLLGASSTLPVFCSKLNYAATISSSFASEQNLQSGDFQSSKTIKYSSNGTDLTLDQVKAFVDGQASCKQAVSWKCSMAPMNSRAGTKIVYWKNRNGDNMAYWGANEAAVGAGIQCQCGASSCEGYGCNCDKVSADWQEDAGVLIKKNDLPVKELVTLNNGQATTQAKFLVGNLICNGA